MEGKIFDYDSYKQYLREIIQHKSKEGRGFQQKLAKTAQCQPAYITRILSDKAHLSLEQADRLNSFLGHTEEETRFFLFLVQYERAGTHTLRRFIYKDLEDMRKKRLSVTERFKKIGTLNRHAQTIYYSSWYYGAMHALVSIPKFQTKEAIAKALSLSLGRVSEILNFLVSCRILKQEGALYKVGEKRFHLDINSPMISKHHMNWRLKAIQSFEQNSFRDDLHYSSVGSISEKDFVRIKSLFMKSIEDSKKIISGSSEEKVFCCSVDFFDLLDQDHPS